MVHAVTGKRDDMELGEKIAKIDELQRQVDALGPDEGERRYELMRQIDELKSGLPTFDKDAGRTREEIKEELAMQKKRLQAIVYETGKTIAPMSDGAGGAGDAATVAMREQAKQSMGIEDVKKRIGELESKLAAMGDES